MKNLVGLAIILANLVGLVAAPPVEGSRRRRKENPQKIFTLSSSVPFSDLRHISNALPNPGTLINRDLANDALLSANREQAAPNRSSGYNREDMRYMDVEAISSETVETKRARISNPSNELDDVGLMPIAQRKSRKGDRPRKLPSSADAQKVPRSSTIYTYEDDGPLDLGLPKKSLQGEDMPPKKAKRWRAANERESPTLSSSSKPTTDANSSTPRTEDIETCHSGKEGEKKYKWVDERIEYLSHMVVDKKMTLEEAIEISNTSAYTQDRGRLNMKVETPSEDIDNICTTPSCKYVLAKIRSPRNECILVEIYQRMLLELERRKDDQECREILMSINEQLLKRKNWRQIVREAVLLYRGDKGNLLQKILSAIGLRLSFAASKSKKKEDKKEDTKSKKRKRTGNHQNEKEEDKQEKNTASCKLVFIHGKDTGVAKKKPDPREAEKYRSKVETDHIISEEWCLGNTKITVLIRDFIGYIPNIPDWEIPLWIIALELLKHMKQDSIRFENGTYRHRTFCIYIPQDPEDYDYVCSFVSLKNWEGKHREALARFLYLLDIRIIAYENLIERLPQTSQLAS